MPVNLNALIRYKTIDECLTNTYLECTIEVFVLRCSEKLAEFQGLDTCVSERTIRNDIRILRSDVLGFNAPIIISRGIYSYDSPNFTLFGRPIKELEILQDIQDILIEEFDNIQNKNVLSLLFALSKITNKEMPRKFYPPESKVLYVKNFKEDTYKNESRIYLNHLKKSSRESVFKNLFKKPKVEIFSWKFIFDALNSSSDS
jgi:hypothetical protein